jgi:hypothetical protein
MVMSMMNAYPRLMAALDEVRRQWRLQKLLEGVLLLLTGAAAVLVLLVAADNFLQPGVWGRAVLATLLWGALLAGLVTLVVRRLLEDRRDDYFAALVEQKYPGLHNRLINALQLGRGNQRGFSPELTEAIVRDADRASADVEMGEAVDSRPARRATIFFAAAAAVLAVYATLFHSYFANGLQRLLRPGADIPPFSQTQVPGKLVQPGNTRVVEGKPVSIAAQTEGVRPASAQLHLRKSGGGWDRFDMQADQVGEGVFRFKVPAADRTFDYYVTAGDGRSPTFRVEVVQPPRIARLSVTTQPPAYTALPATPVEESDGKVVGLTGTRVDLQLKASKALQKAVLTTKEGDVLELQKQGDEQTWGCSFVLWSKEARPARGVAGRLLNAPTTYRIQLLDSEGYESADPLWRPIDLTRDNPPKVELLTPGDKLPLQPKQTLDLTLVATDDYGLDVVRLLYRVNGEDNVREKLTFTQLAAPQRDARHEHKWYLSGGGFKAGDHVEYWAEAVDRNNITGPGKGESNHFTFDVVNPAEVGARLDLNVMDYAKVLEALLKLQRENRVGTAEAAAFNVLVDRQALIRTNTRKLARAMEKDTLPLQTMVQSLDKLAAGLMAEVLKLLESGRDTAGPARQEEFRSRSLPVQDKIIAELEALLARLQRNEEAKKALRKMEQKDPAKFKKVAATLGDMIKNLDQLLKDQTELAGKFERLPKRDPDAFKEEQLKALNELDEKMKRAQKWAKGSVNEMTKMAPGFVDDFGLRPDVN